MEVSYPNCPNCMRPMSLTRQDAPDDLYEGQDAFYCGGCEVGLYRAAIKDEPL